MEEKAFRTKKERAYHCIKESIISGQLKPKEKLIISTIAKQLGVSEIPVREALQTLVQEGLADLVPHAGFVVSSLSATDVKEIFELRANLESMASRMAVRYLSNMDIEKLARMVDDSRQFMETKDFHGYWEMNRALHLELYRHCGNKRLINYLNDLYSYSRRFPPYFSHVSELDKSIAGHENMIKILEARDEKGIEAYMTDHCQSSYRHVIRRFVEYFRANGEDDEALRDFMSHLE
jgi:Transcriptional regulators